MAEVVSPKPPQSPFQNVRTTGRALDSPNWRMKAEKSPDAVPTSPSPQTNTSRTAFARPGPHAPQAISEGRRLYVGNMPYTAKSADVEALFRAAEFPIERIDIAIDPFTGRNPSYCFVDVQTKEQAARAMFELDGRDLMGRPVKIKPGVQKSASSTVSGSLEPRLDQWRRQTQPSFAKTHSDSSRRVYVGGLPRLTDQDAVKSNIRTFFEGFQVEEISKLFTPHPAKRFEPGEHYYLFVDLVSVEAAERAMDSLHEKMGPWGGALRVRRCNRREEK
ncbi:hypothetical protein N7532_007318 [Penicillium argentinense]|uniref:RRM domain-containing protein n=1 Tax=Penicillium argentinense TaxID=1131581 RepID=A0A9W9K7I0_9EURO|nr:uncharacterized protein N7532_007318 [Penicillium argentinense]KAJ5095027.1 hypothetical protein N7532_007318 [Penicillium argentinense]